MGTVRYKLGENCSRVTPRGTALSRGRLETNFYCLGLGLGLGLQYLGLCLGLEGWCIGKTPKLLSRQDTQ